MATVDMAEKRELLCLFHGELGPRLIQYCLGQGLLLYQVASSSIQPFSHNRHGKKLNKNQQPPFFAMSIEAKRLDG